MSEEIIEIYKKGRLERREMIFEHLENLKSVDVLKISNTLEEAVFKATNEIAAFVQKERLDVLNLCLPEAKEKTNE